MMRPIVFVDTNTVENKGSAQYFLGGRSDLEKIGRRADIALPRVVFDELCRHVCSYLINQKDSFRKNPHRHFLKIKDDSIEQIDPNKIVASLVEHETIEHLIVDLVDEKAAYREIYEHAIKGTPPFEPSGDKGFKDALIAKTVDQYVSSRPNQKIFLMTKDDRLKEYFEENKKVVIISSYDDFDREYSDDKLSEEGLVERLQDYLKEAGVVMSKNKRPDRQWLNFEGNIVARFNNGSEGVWVLVASTEREPISFVIDDINEALEELERVGSFAHAHIAVAGVDSVFDYYDIDDVKRLAHTLLSNDQIYSIGGDDDISQFASRVFAALRENGEPELARDLANMYNLNQPVEERVSELLF